LSKELVQKIAYNFEALKELYDFLWEVMDSEE